MYMVQSVTVAWLCMVSFLNKAQLVALNCCAGKAGKVKSDGSRPLSALAPNPLIGCRLDTSISRQTTGLRPSKQKYYPSPHILIRSPDMASAWWTTGCLYGATAVIFGAFGAHGLKSRISDPARIANWSTAAHYQVSQK